MPHSSRIPKSPSEPSRPQIGVGPLLQLAWYIQYVYVLVICIGLCSCLCTYVHIDIVEHEGMPVQSLLQPKVGKNKQREYASLSLEIFLTTVSDVAERISSSPDCQRSQYLERETGSHGQAGAHGCPCDWLLALESFRVSKDQVPATCPRHIAV